MIHCVATIRLKPGHRDSLIPLLKDFAARVRAHDDGCHGYVPLFDVTGEDLPPPRPDVITMLEAWRDLAALNRHNTSEAFIAFQKQAAAHMEGMDLQIMTEA